MTDGDSSHWLARYVRTNLRFLAFRNTPIAAADRERFIKAALVCTWIAGIGRYWDHPDAFWWQYAGLGSLVYVFLMSVLLGFVGQPLVPRAWNMPNVLLFVAMTSPLAWLYAIPVERFMPIEAAVQANAWFLAVVAAWRVALLIRFFAKPSGLGWIVAPCVALLPLAGIVTALALFNLEHATFEIMASGDTQTTSNDGAYAVVILLTYFSWIALPILIVAYVVAIVVRRRAIRRRRLAGVSASERRS
jgi:hypothetical protein